MSSLNFTQKGVKYESEGFVLSQDSVVELVFDSVPDFTGVTIDFFISLSGDNWQCCYTYTLRNSEGNTFCKSIQGASEKATYKIVCSVEPVTAIYE